MNKAELIAYLSGFVTENRLQRFNEAIAQRTRFLTVVLEDIYQPHNAAAVLRSCDCFGIQDVHVIENKNKFDANPDVELGSAKWLSIIRHNQSDENTTSCIAQLKKDGYKVVITSPHKNDCNIDELPLDEKTALFFGTEMRGATSVAIEQADAFVKIPMVGFTESLNISVSAAVVLYALTGRLRASDLKWQLSKEDEEVVRLNWLRNSIPKSEILERDYLNK